MTFRVPRPFRKLRNADGNVAIEYALLGAIVGLGTISALRTMRGGISQNLTRAGGNMMLATAHINRCDTLSNCQVIGSPYQMGFATNPDSGKILTSGWSSLEDYHVWSTGKTSVVTMDLGSLINTNAPSATLNMWSSAFMAQANQTDVTTSVVVNGVNVGTITYAKGSSGDTRTVTLNNDAMIAIAQNNGMAVITFQSSASGRPVDYGYNSDGRDLGIAIADITVNPGK
jgi:Flp pilus assembly pilin Flp